MRALATALLALALAPEAIAQRVPVAPAFCSVQTVRHARPDCSMRTVCGPICPARGRPYVQPTATGDLYIVCLGEQRVIKVRGLPPGVLTSEPLAGRLNYTPDRCR